MKKEDLANGSPFVPYRRFLSASLGVACSITVSPLPLLANGPGASPLFQPVTAPVANFQHSPTLPNAAFSNGGLPNTGHLTAGTSAAQTWHSSAAALRGRSRGQSSPFTAAPGSHDLDLASAQANILASNLGGFHNLTIVVGGVKQVLSLDSKLTGGEAVAAEQVLSGGRQTIKLAADGQATGGSVSLNNNLLTAMDNALGGSINTLTIAHGVKVIDDLSLLSLTGSLDNDGSILTASTTAHSSDVISAGSITNAAGSAIGSYSGAAAGLFAADPILNALTSVTNNGSISSAGDLTINAPAVYNVAGYGGSAPSISSRQNLNINTQSLTNSGLIASLSGNVNAGNVTSANTNAGSLGNLGSLSLANSGGTIQALGGNINLTTDNADVSVSGGDLLSRQVNLKAQAGDVSLNAANVSGIINASGDSVHIVTVSSQKLGNIDTSGDPGFVSLAGNITIDGTIAPSNGADLAIIAGGNILSGTKGVLDTSTTAGGNGGNLTLVAGANVSGNDAAAVVASGAGSATGGLIDLTGKNGGTGAITEITSAGVGAAGNGGYIEMVAYAGSATGSGSITVPTKVAINAAGSGTGTNGSITLIAGATSGTSGTAITTGAITGGQVTVLSQTPSAAAGGVTFNNGTSTSGIGGFTGTAGTTSAISVGAITSSQGVAITTGGAATAGKITADGSGTGVSGAAGLPGGTINISAAGNIVTGELDAFGGGGVGGGSNGLVAGGAGGDGGTIKLTSSTGSIAVTGNVNVSGGGGGGGAGSTPTVAFGDGGAGGTAGAVSLSASTNTTVSGEVYAYDGGAGNNGGTAGTIGSGGGGGGGGSYGGGGGGGAGGASASPGINAGGGGGGGSLLAPGGGGAGTTGGGGTADGGSGGGYIALGAGGTASGGGSNGLAGSGTRGGNGGKGLNIAGGSGGTNPKGGSGGASAVASGTGNPGLQAQVVGGQGSLSFTLNGNVGSAKAPLKFEAGQLTVTGGGAGSAFVSDISGAQLDVAGINIGALGSIVLSTKANTITNATGGIIDVTGAVSGGTLNFSTAGTTASIDINSTVVGTTTLTTTGSSANVSITGVISGASTTINTLGTITTSGTGSINSTTVTVASPQAITVDTDAANLSVTDKSANVTITQGANALNLLTSSVASSSGTTFTVDSTGQLNVVGAITGGTSNTITLDTTGAAGGVNIGSTIAGGTVNITTSGTAGITATTAGKVTAGVINLTSANNIGSSGAVVTVDNNLALGQGNALTLITGATGSAYVTDLGTTDLTLNATSASSGLLSVSSAASAFNVVQAPYANITLADTNPNTITPGGVITLNSGSTAGVLIGNGNGVVTINSTGNIVMNSNTTGIEGTAVNLTSTLGDVGVIALVVNSPNITASAAKGEVYIFTNQAGTVNFTGSSGIQLYVTDTANSANLIVNGNLACQDIQILCTGTNANLTTNGILGISAKDLGYTVQLNPTNDLTINGNIIADDVFLGSNHFTGLPILLGTVLVQGTVTADQTVELADNQSLGGITINGAMTGNQVIMMSDIANININASITTKTDPELFPSNIKLTSQGANIVFAPGVALTATGYINIDMAAGTGAIGSLATPLITKAQAIDLTFGGSVYINNTGTVQLFANSTTTTGAFAFNNTGGGVALVNSGGTPPTFSSVSSGSIIITATGPITVGTSQDTTSTSLISTGVLTLTSTSTINNFGTLSGANVSISGTSFNNINPTGLTATLAASSALSISNPAGALTITGATGSITTPAAGALSLIATGAITVGNSKTDPLSDVTTSALHSLVVSAGGNFSVGWSGLTVVNDVAGDGGIINISANNLIDNGAKLTTAFDLFANGSTATGAAIVLDIPGNAAALTTGAAVGDYNISAVGTNGATIFIQTGGNLTANMSNLLYNGTSGTALPASLTLIAGGRLLINGNINTHTGTGAYGPVILSSGSPLAFVVGGAAGTLNGQIGIVTGTGEGIFGSTVTITDNAGITINSGFDVEASSGNLALNTTNLTNNGTLSTPGALTITNKGNITYPPVGAGTYNMAGLIIDSTGGNITISSAISIQPLVPFTTLELLAPKGTLTLPSSTTSLTVGALAGGNGGTLDLSAKTLKSSLTALSAAGSTGSGGSINFTLTGTTALTVGTGGLTFDVANGSGSKVSGSLTVANSGNLTVNGNGLNLGTGTGANLTLAAGTTTAKGVLLISNIASLVTAAQPFNNLILQSNSTGAFSLGGATTKTNGIVDTGVSLTAQTMTIANYGGGITQGTSVGTGGTPTALAATKGAMDLVAGKGGIGVSSTTPLTVSAVDLAISTSGSAFINNTNAGAVSLDAVSVSKTLDYTSTAGIVASANLLVPTLILNVASIAPVITTSATSLTVTATSGAVAFTDTQTATVTVNTLSSSGSVSLTSGGAITTSATSDVSGSAITLTAGGKAAGNITIGNSLTSAGTVDLTAAGKGIITESGKTAVVNAGTLNLVTQGGNIGASQAKPFVVDATTLSTNTGTGKTGSAFIKNNALSTTIAASTVGSTFNYTGSITAASGAITAPTLILTLSSMNTTLTTNATTLQGTTATGNLDITDTQTGLVKINTSSATAANGQINVASGGSITTAGVISGSGAVVLTAGGTAGSITIGKNITSLISNVTLQATGTGSIIESSGTVMASPGAGTVSLITAGGNIGSTTKSVATNAATITLTAGATGNVYLTNTDSLSTGTVSLSSASVGSLKFTETNTSAKNTGTLTVNSINAGGSTGAITIASNEQALDLAEGSTITTTNGNITLQNTYVANKTNLPSISIGLTTATTIHALSTGSAATGNVFIALGTLATASTVKPGTIPTPSPNTSASTTKNLITYGTTSNPNGSITTGANDTFTSLSGNLSFTTGKNAATQIIVGSNVTIIADPPLGAATEAVVPAATISSSRSPEVAAAPPAVPSATSATAIAVHDIVQTQIQSNSLNQIDFQNQITGQNQLLPQLQLPLQSQSLVQAQLQSQELTQVQISSTNALSTIVEGGGNFIRNSASTLSPTKLKGKVSSTNHETLGNGASLFAPKQDTIIDTPFGSVGIAKGSIAMVIASENGLAVYDLHDLHEKSIFIDCGQGLATISLSPGRSAVFTHQGVDQFEKINPAPKVAYKKIAGRPIGTDHMVYQGEFEIFSMIQSLGPLRNMLGSNDSAIRKTAIRMIKTAAILSQLTDGEPYSLFAAPEVTASLPTQHN